MANVYVILKESDGKIVQQSDSASLSVLIWSSTYGSSIKLDSSTGATRTVSRQAHEEVQIFQWEDIGLPPKPQGAKAAAAYECEVTLKGPFEYHTLATTADLLGEPQKGKVLVISARPVDKSGAFSTITDAVKWHIGASWMDRER